MGRPRVRVSFSGGRTSGYMAKRLKDELCSTTEMLFLFANTGEEDERTLAFVDRCDREWSLGLVMVEAEVDPRLGVGTGFRQVAHTTASRSGEPFEAVIAKYGIPNQVFQPCNRELKLRPMDAYAKSVGWAAQTYDTAIGIRADEVDRMNPKAAEQRIIYPLVKWGITKADVRRWWQAQPFDLDVPEHLGNCRWCWKKSPRKLLTLAKDHPEVFDFPARMEAEHPFSGAGDGPRRFFRGNWTTLDLKARARLPFEPFVESQPPPFDPDLDAANGCSESCDIYAAEDLSQFDLFRGAA